MKLPICVKLDYTELGTRVIIHVTASRWEFLTLKRWGVPGTPLSPAHPHPTSSLLSPISPSPVARLLSPIPRRHSLPLFLETPLAGGGRGLDVRRGVEGGWLSGRVEADHRRGGGWAPGWVNVVCQEEVWSLTTRRGWRWLCEHFCDETSFKTWTLLTRRTFYDALLTRQQKLAFFPFRLNCHRLTKSVVLTKLEVKKS